jgi:hypothetical protein
MGLLTQTAQAAVRKKGSHFQSLFRRFLPRLAHNGTLWLIAHRRTLDLEDPPRRSPLH